tara:strand:+ start:406 stop:1221 length:816 start_codon:yes stop_codon:yes gene_type:complete
MTDNTRIKDTDNITYGEYLHLDKLLAAQHPRSEAHDEFLFIIQHQTSELWMQLAIHEMNAARNAISDENLQSAFKILSRLSRIFDQLNNSWDVLRTMTPSDYTTFRENLTTASGFQSYQYRMIEFIFGNRNAAMMKMHEHLPDIYEGLKEELKRPSLYAVVVRLLFQTLDGKKAPVPEIPLDKAHSARPIIQAKWKFVYRNIETNWHLYELAEKLIDLEDYFRRWRFNHVTTVERVIGFKRGTGGTEGVGYLRRMLDVELFPELWHVRGEI